MLSLPPELAESIDRSMRADLLLWSSKCFDWLILSVKIVAIGLLFEAPELVIKILDWVKRPFLRRRERRQLNELSEIFPICDVSYVKATPKEEPDWVMVFALIGWFLVLVGVAGEWLAEVKVEEASSAIQAFDSTRLTQAQRQAGAAALSASIAHGEAVAAGNEAGKAKHSALVAQRRSSEIDNELAKQVERVKAAEGQLEAEKLKRVELAASLLPRDFRDQSGAIKELSRFPRTTVAFEYIDEREVRDTAEKINFVFGELHWDASRLRGQEWAIRDGVIVFPGPRTAPPDLGTPPDWKKWDAWTAQDAVMRNLCETLIRLLNETDIEARLGYTRNDVPPGTFVISVGPKTNRVLEEALKELAKPGPTTIKLPNNINLTASGNRRAISQAPALACCATH